MKGRGGWLAGSLSIVLAVSGWLTAAALPLLAEPPTAAPAASPVEQTRPVDYERLPFMKQSAAETGTEAPSTGGLLLRTLGALCLILGLLIAATWGLRRFGGTQFGGAPPEACELAVLATLPLGERRSVTAVRFGDQLLLLGATAQSVTLLAQTDRPARSAPPRMRSVAELLAEDVGPEEAGPEVADPEEVDTDLIDRKVTQRKDASPAEANTSGVYSAGAGRGFAAVTETAPVSFEQALVMAGKRLAAHQAEPAARERNTE
jgi:flagellar biosynthetic protein FliO